MWRLPSSVLKSILVAIRNDPEVRRHLASHPRFWDWLRKRFSTNEPFGLRLTVGVALSVIFLLLFLSVVEDLISKDPLVVADLRLLSLVQMFRSPLVNAVMLFLTYLGNWQVVAAGACLFAVYFALTRQWHGFLALFISILGGEFLVWVGKAGFARPRPDLVNALIPAHGLSFPSGHAFVAISFYGLVAWFATERAGTKVAKVTVVVVATILVLAIGLSRIYLGVHWPSDVLASFALGAAWLAIIITSFSVARASKRGAPYQTPAWATRLAVLLYIVWIGVVAVFNYTHPLVAQHAPVATAVDMPQSDFPSALFAVAPRFSEDIVGKPMEPINVILVGSEDDLTKAFADAGWEPTDRISLGSSLRLLTAELSNEHPARAPGLPTFWHGQPNQRGFQHVDPMGSARERHHLHVWDTAFRVANDAVWVGTVHFDREARTAGGIGLLIHQIDPAVDRERQSLRSDFSQSKCTRRIDEAVVTEPMLGQNAVGSPFFTDGNAIVIFLKCQGA